MVLHRSFLPFSLSLSLSYCFSSYSIRSLRSIFCFPPLVAFSFLPLALNPFVLPFLDERIIYQSCIFRIMNTSDTKHRKRVSRTDSMAREQFSSFCLTPTSKSRRQPETRRDARKWSRCRVSSNSIERFGDGLPLRMEKRRNGAGVCNLRSSENRYRLSRSFDCV